MEEQREESEFVGDCREPMEEAGKGLALSSKIETLAGEDVTTVEISDSGESDVSATDENPNDGGSATEDGITGNSVSDEKHVKADAASVDDMAETNDNIEERGAVETKDNVEETVSSDDVEKTDAFTELETQRNEMECAVDAGTVEVNPVDEREGSELYNDVQSVSKTAKSVDVEKNDDTAINDASHESAGEEETVTSAGYNVIDEKANCEVDHASGPSDAEQNFQAEKSQQSLVDGETLSVAEEKADQEKESAKKSEDGNNKMDADSKQTNEENVGLHEQGNMGSETRDTNNSETSQVPEVSTQLSIEDTNEENPGTVTEVGCAAEICREEDITDVNQKEENGEAMEIDYAAEEPAEKNVTIDGVLDNAGNESAGASMVQSQDVQIAEADRNDSNVVKEMEVDERKDIADMASDFTGTIKSADSANPNSPTEDAATGEVEPLDHNALFDPSSDITNFIDFSGVSSWSGNIQDLKTETNESLREGKKAIYASVNAESHDNLSLSAEGIQNESTEACVAFGAESPPAAAECRREASDVIMESDENKEEKDHECIQQDAMREEDDNTREAPCVDPNQKEDTEMEENPNNSDYADDGTDSDIKTNGLKRKADVLSEGLPGEGRKTVSLAKVSFTQRPSFKIGACIARAASQMAGSPSVLKGSNVGDETLSVESFVSQLQCAATDPVKENFVSEIAAGFFLDFRNSSASQQFTPEKVGSKRGRPSDSNAGGTEAFEFEEMGDTYWTDRVIHNGGEEQTPPTEKGNYQVVPVELKPSQVRRTRRPYRRRQSQISIPQQASNKPANFDENAPAELIMNFSETDTIPPEKSLNKMFRHFGPIRESQTEVDQENNRARVVYRKGTDAEVAYNSAGRFSIFGTKAVNYELSYTITEAFKVHPYVVSLGEEDAAHCLPS